MASVKGSASYKKKDGSLLLLKDSVTWTPAVPPGAPASLSIPIPTITSEPPPPSPPNGSCLSFAADHINSSPPSDLQATPATTAKVMIKVFAKTTPEKDPEQYVFTFTSASAARTEADAMKEALTTRIQEVKSVSGSATPATGVATTGATSAAVAAAMSGKLTDWSKARLETDMELQQSLLKSDADLTRTFSEAVLSGAVTAPQFWSTRTHLLRAHAIEREQKRGPYNVLATIKPKTEDGVAKMAISQDVIRDIFDQHPLVKSVYDESVPKLSDQQFWSKFFTSRLFKELKGEKILPGDQPDPVFDRYLNKSAEENSRKRRKIEHVPRTIDLEGNEQNLSQKQGNRPDLTMRPTRVDNVPIIRTLNSLSQKLVDLVAPADADPHENEDQDAYYFASQTLQDLRGDPEEERIILNIRDQRRFFSGEDDEDQNKVQLSEGMDAAIVLEELRMAMGDGNINLNSVLPKDDDSDNEETRNTSSGKIRPSDATKQITAAVYDRRSQMLHASGYSGASGRTGGLPLNVFESVQLVHATTNEFLRHFWSAFLSGDEKRAADITKLVTGLGNSKGRIEAIAKTADEEKEVGRVRKRKEAQEEYRRTGLKPKRKSTEVGGGRKVVEEILGPVMNAVETALSKYQSALDDAEKMGAV